MAKITPDETGTRIEKVRVPFPDVTSEKAQKLESALNSELIACKLGMRKPHSGIDTPGFPTVSIREKGILKWPTITGLVNRMLDPMKSGTPERIRFLQFIPRVWVEICALGTEDQKAWFQKRTKKFGRRYDLDMPDLLEPDEMLQ